MGWMLALIMTFPGLPLSAQDDVVRAARAAIGTPYVLGGRLRRVGDGLDCQGLVFFALQPVSTCGWRSWSVMPTESVRGELGLPVPGAAPVAAADVEAMGAKLEPGDIVWFLDGPENPAEPSLTRLHGVPMWVWHVGLCVGAGRVVLGDHFAGAVVEEDLVAYTRAHYAGVFVTRMSERPTPGRCRVHAPMVLSGQ